MKKTLTNKEKAAIALRALKEQETISSIASQAGIHSVQVGMWKKTLKTHAHELFGKTKKEMEQIRQLGRKVDELHRIIGKRDEEISWLEKKIAP